MTTTLKRLSLAVQGTLVFITMLTIGAELIGPLKSWLAMISGHHWVSKGLLSLIFMGVSLVCLSVTKFSAVERPHSFRLSPGMQVSVVTMICSISLMLFFMWHYFKL